MAAMADAVLAWWPTISIAAAVVACLVLAWLNVRQSAAFAKVRVRRILQIRTRCAVRGRRFTHRMRCTGTRGSGRGTGEQVPNWWRRACDRRQQVRCRRSPCARVTHDSASHTTSCLSTATNVLQRRRLASCA